jgi:aryl-alcohol dehydrogenase-like predicted oxidoreductase
MAARFVNDATPATPDRMAGIAREHGVAPANFAIAWTLTRDFVGSTIIGATSRGQLDEAPAAADGQLGAEVLQAIDALSSDIR